MKTTGLIIKNYRRKLKMSQSELAEKLGKSQVFLSNLENDNKKLSESLSKKLQEVLKISDMDMATIYFYEEFREAPPLIQMAYFNQQEEIERLKEKLSKVENLEKVLDYYESLK